MKIFLCGLLFFCLNLNIVASQNTKTPFIRIYNVKGEKIAKGQLHYTTDSSMYVALGSKDTLSEIKYSSIGLVKKGRSKGNTMIYSTAIPAATFGILALVSHKEMVEEYYLFGPSKLVPNPNSAGQEAAQAAIGGAILGGLTGAIVSGLKQTKEVKIEKINNSWQNVNQQLGFWLK